MKKYEVVIVGSGFSGLSTAAFLSKSGIRTTVIEKNKQLGGRARMLKKEGFSFDMGPSWYWMPDIFDNIFKELNEKTENLYELIQLDPGFRMIFECEEIDIASDFEETCSMFEKYETGGAKNLKRFMQDAKSKYNIGINFIYNSPGTSGSLISCPSSLKILIDTPGAGTPHDPGFRSWSSGARTVHTESSVDP